MIKLKGFQAKAECLLNERVLQHTLSILFKHQLPFLRFILILTTPPIFSSFTWIQKYKMTSDAIIHMEQSLFVNTTLQMLPNDRAKYKHSS